MKAYLKINYILIIFASFSLWSCKDYLDKTLQADISEEDIFSTWEKFQGYAETMYDDVVDPIHLSSSFGSFNYADDNIPIRTFGFIEGDYFKVISRAVTQYYNTSAVRSRGTWSGNSIIRQMAIWQNSWFGIRAANQCLAHLKYLVDATDEQRQLIKGQAYFFRGYFHWELMKAWGNIPYVDTVFTAVSELKVKQLGLYITAEKILNDLKTAEDLLPEDWDDIVSGQPTLGKNFGRPTKGQALALQAEALLFCGSPLFNGIETGNYVYNTDYCKRAAEAAWKVIEIANNGKYALTTWANYFNNFFTKNSTFPVTKEIILSPPYRGTGYYFQTPCTFLSIGGESSYISPTQNYIEYFEASNGLPIDDPAANFDPMNPWVNRDPRFKYNIYVDGDRIVRSLNDDRAFAQLYIGGRERSAQASVTGFGWRKFVDETINKYDGTSGVFRFNLPRMRLAEIYLIYAEAANEAYNGPYGKDPNAIITALDAVNKIRTRAGMPDVNAKFLTDKETFRARIWNERAVEFAYEGKRREDLRRWHVATDLKYRELYELQFDMPHTYFKKVLVKTINFAEQHYWLPFPTNQITLYSGWKQNPGW